MISIYLSFSSLVITLRAGSSVPNGTFCFSSSQHPDFVEPKRFRFLDAQRTNSIGKGLLLLMTPSARYHLF
jgi:hypothetical protein